MTPVVIKKKKTNTTDVHLLVFGGLTYEDWDKERIINYLIKRLDLEKEKAKKIAEEVEKRVIKSGCKKITTRFIREICDSILLEEGIIDGNEILNASLPVEDIEEFLFEKSKENSNLGSLNPEASAFFISGKIIKQYMLNKVFSKEVRDAHIKGKIHLHDLDMPRAYCHATSPALILKHGLDIPDLDVVSSPPRNCRSFIGQICSFLASIQAYYAGALALTFVNNYFSPLTKDLSDRELYQEMQHFIFQLSQTAFSRGSQTLFSDINLFIETPPFLANKKAIGAGGKEIDVTYKDLEDESLRILLAILDIVKKGDASGAPFAFPKINLNLSKACFENPKYKEVLLKACEAASVNGSVYFVFNYDAYQLASCCRLRGDIDEEYIENPFILRFNGIQNVTINFPQVGYRLKERSYENIINELKKTIDIAIKAHKQKKRFLKKLMERGCMQNVNKPILGLEEPYLDLDRGTYIIGIAGLNDLLYLCRGKHMHEDEMVFLEGLRIIAELDEYLQQKSKETGLKLVLEESPGESSLRRLSLVDLQQFPEAKNIVRGTLENPYYTNSIHFIPEAQISLVERIRRQSKFHPFIKAGAIIHAFVGEELPPAKSIFNLLEKVYKDGNCKELVFSPEFTSCGDCKQTTLGLKEECGFCGSKNVFHITRIVGYYSKVQNWHGSKKEELKDRHKGNYQ